MSTSVRSDLALRCAYTPRYLPYAERWMHSFEGAGYKNVKTYDYRDLGDWNLNCLMKPSMFYEGIFFRDSEEYRDYVLMDADCVLVPERAHILDAKISEWRKNEVEFAVHHFPGREMSGQKKGLWYSAGFVYIDLIALGFLVDWRERCLRFLASVIAGAPVPKFPEQHALADAVKFASTFFKPGSVPLSFNCRPPDPKDRSAPFDMCPEPVIKHLPASRETLCGEETY